jgi:hypothetical protein
MSYVPVKKGTILIPSGPSIDKMRKHLFVICTDACNQGCQLLVPICTWTNNLCDGTCVIDPYEHAFLRSKSYVLYRKSLIYESKKLVAGVEAKSLIPDKEMNGQTFLKVRNGICKSSETPRKVKLYAGCEIEFIAASTPSTGGLLDASVPH